MQTNVCQSGAKSIRYFMGNDSSSDEDFLSIQPQQYNKIFHSIAINGKSVFSLTVEVNDISKQTLNTTGINDKVETCQKRFVHLVVKYGNQLMKSQLFNPMFLYNSLFLKSRATPYLAKILQHY